MSCNKLNNRNSGRKTQHTEESGQAQWNNQFIKYDEISLSVQPRSTWLSDLDVVERVIFEGTHFEEDEEWLGEVYDCALLRVDQLQVDKSSNYDSHFPPTRSLKMQFLAWHCLPSLLRFACLPSVRSIVKQEKSF